MRSTPRIAITGLGAVTPYGMGLEALLDGLRRSRGAIEPLSVFPNPLDAVPVVGQVRVPLDAGAPAGLTLSRTDRLAILAARQAVASLEHSSPSRGDCAVVVATTVGGLGDLDGEIVDEPGAYFRRAGIGPASSYPASHVGEAVAAALGIRGPRYGVSVACASGAIAIALGARMIADGRACSALVGGSDALCSFTLAGFNSLQALDPAPCRPFCETRRGLNLGEGAAMLLLEDEALALSRGAQVFGYVDGWAFTNDAFHPTAPDEAGRGLARCMRLAMETAGASQDEIGYVNAHGTGTRLNDVAEIRAHAAAFADRTAPIPVSSTKSHIGHTLGAAGAIEAVITLLSLRTGELFPTLRLTSPIPNPAVHLVQTLESTAMLTAMSVSAGFGGSNAALVLRARGK